MKLAKIRHTDGSVAVGAVAGDQFTAFDMSGEQTPPDWLPWWSE